MRGAHRAAKRGGRRHSIHAMASPLRDCKPRPMSLVLRALAVSALLALALLLAAGGRRPASTAEPWTPAPTHGADRSLCERARTDAGGRPAACTGIRSTTPAVQRPADPRRPRASVLAA